MADESVFVFKFQDEGQSAPPVTTPGTATRAAADAEPTVRPRRPEGDEGRERTPRSPKSGESERFGQPILDAIKQIGQYRSLASFAATGEKLFRPLLDLGQLVQDIRRGSLGTNPQPGRASSLASNAPASFTLRDAKVLIIDSQVVIPNAPADPQEPRFRPRSPESPEEPVRPRRGVPPEPPRERPRRGPVPPSPRGPAPSNLPALRRSTLPARVPTIDFTRRAAPVAAAAAAPALANPVGLAIGAVVVSATALAGAFWLVTKRANEHAGRLAAYDATLAVAQARAQVANVQQDIRSARYLGNELAEFTKAQSELKVAWTQTADKFEKALLPYATTLLEIMTGVLNGVNKIEDVSALLREIADGTTAIWDAGKRLAELEQGRQREELRAASLANDFYGLFKNTPKLDVDGNEGRAGVAGPREDIDAPGFGPLPMP